MVWKIDQTTRTIPFQTITHVEETGASPQVNTTYWVSYDFSAATHRAWLQYNNYVLAIGRGQMRLSIVTTVNSAGTGGFGGGQGGGVGGGAGAPGRALPGL